MEGRIIPQLVIDEAQDLINCYGNTLAYRGVYNGCDIYQFIFPKNKEIGFPVIYLCDVQANLVLEITGFRALDILKELTRTTSEI